MIDHQDKAFTRRIVEFTANAHRACPHCHAPGQYLSDPVWLDRYPEIVKPLSVGLPVGPVCPCCGGARSARIDRRSKRKEWWIVRLPDWLASLTARFSHKGQSHGT